MDSLVLDTVIGLVFIFATFALLISLITELITRFMGLRGEYLMRGLRSMVDENPTFDLQWRDLIPFRKPSLPDSPNVLADTTIRRIVGKSYIKMNGSQATLSKNAGVAKLSNKDRRALPSYLSSRAFSTAVIDLLIPTENGTVTIDAARERVRQLPKPLSEFLDAQLRAVGADVDKLRANIESWYDDHMSRVSGWYKRHVRWISLIIGALIVLLFNVSAVRIGQALYTDEALRGSVVTQAVAASNCQSESADVCLGKVRQQIEQDRSAGLPLGWALSPVCEEGRGTEAPCSLPETYGFLDPAHGGFGANLLFFLTVLLGWTIMVLALLPGARFWFDALAQLGSLRSTGPKPGT